MIHWTDQVFKSGILCLTVLIAAGCAQISSQIPGIQTGLGSGQETDAQYDLTPAEQELRRQGEDLDQSFLDGVVGRIDYTILEGALASAGAGAAFAFATGGDTGKIWKAAVATGLIGTIAGAFLSSQQMKYASTEDALDDTVQKVRDRNQKIEAYIATAQGVLNENRLTLENLEKQLALGSVTEKNLAEKRRIILANRGEVNTSIKSSQSQLEFFQKTFEQIKQDKPNMDVLFLEKQIDRNATNIETLEKIDYGLGALGSE